MTIIELPIPDEIDRELNSLPLDKKQFIIEAVRAKLKETRDSPLRDELIEGYKNSQTENKMLLQEFEVTDLNNWDEY